MNEEVHPACISSHSTPMQVGHLEIQRTGRTMDLCNTDLMRLASRPDLLMQVTFWLKFCVGLGCVETLTGRPSFQDSQKAGIPNQDFPFKEPRLLA